MNKEEDKKETEKLPDTATEEELKEEKELFDFFHSNGITEYTNQPHKRVYTCEEADKYCEGVIGAFTKTLLLKDKKSPEPNLWLVITLGHTRLNLKKLSKNVGAVKHLTFTNQEELKKYLGLAPGAVTPLALLRDKDKKIKIAIDKTIWTGNYNHEGKGLANFHPLHNCASTTMKIEDLIKFIEATGHKVDYNFDSSEEESK